MIIVITGVLSAFFLVLLRGAVVALRVRLRGVRRRCVSDVITTTRRHRRISSNWFFSLLVSTFLGFIIYGLNDYLAITVVPIYIHIVHGLITYNTGVSQSVDFILIETQRNIFWIVSLTIQICETA